MNNIAKHLLYTLLVFSFFYYIRVNLWMPQFFAPTCTCWTGFMMLQFDSSLEERELSEKCPSCFMFLAIMDLTFYYLC